ncbi:MAG: aldehyde ferredoxin oxidoreductase [Deltaproteobacteria bacterium HGW-Deltaproteobacteria-12]|nr:MAG: aldehyde ferredoxin oxidoreductase [Deltaproteobacteria bacterium HGW-Deltaproteobacteria-12]
MNRGYMGKVLWVDLSKSTIREEKIPDEVYEKYLSGLGLASYLLYERIPAGADPLGPDNILGFVSGLLTGTGSLFSGRWMAVGKSPLTGGWGDANCGGTLSPAIKRSGYDGIFFTGISEKPVILTVKNGVAELKDASSLWGKDTVETEEQLKNEYGTHACVATIGPAGEKLSLISGISNDRGRLAARSGLGAVMGAKRLKAIVLEGKKRIGVQNRDEMHRLSRQCNRWVQFQLPLGPGRVLAYMGTLLRILPTGMAMDGLVYKFMLRQWGTASMNQMSPAWGDSPVKNWKGSNEDWDLRKSGSAAPELFAEHETAKYHCYSCPLGCGGICSYPGKYNVSHKPEYESVLALGGLCMNEDTASLFYLNEYLNRAGMDTISAGATVAFALECFEKGIINSADTGGIDLKWGDSKSITELLHMIVNREGIGDLLADGVKVAATRIGKGAAAYAIHAGGQEPAMHDGRMDPGFAVAYSVEPAPGRHTIGAYLYYDMFQLWKKVAGLPRRIPFQIYSKNSLFQASEKHAQESVACSKFTNVINGAGLCMFGAFLGIKRAPTFDWLNASTGWNKTPKDYMDIGERIQTTRQAFNIKQGKNPRDNRLSDRAVGIKPMTHGANKGRTVQIDKMMSDYWKLFGWDTKTGIPTDESMKRLGINPW